MRLHGNVYKQPNITESKLDDLANGFLIGTKIQDLPGPQQTQARNVTAEIYVIQQQHPNLTFSLLPDSSAGSSGEAGGEEVIAYVNETTVEGDYDSFVQIQNFGLLDGNATNTLQKISVYANGTEEGNATSYLVPSKGLSIISDIDDILRVTKIWDPKVGIENTFANAFTPWLNMPSIYANWSRSLPDFHFHYLTSEYCPCPSIIHI